MKELEKLTERILDDKDDFKMVIAQMLSHALEYSDNVLLSNL